MELTTWPSQQRPIRALSSLLCLGEPLPGPPAPLPWVRPPGVLAVPSQLVPVDPEVDPRVVLAGEGDGLGDVVLAVRQRPLGHQLADEVRVPRQVHALLAILGVEAGEHLIKLQGRKRAVAAALGKKG